MKASLLTKGDLVRGWVKELQLVESEGRVVDAVLSDMGHGNIDAGV